MEKKQQIMNEAKTRAELIDPKLKASSWGVVDGSKVTREYKKIQTGGRAKPLIADYVLVYRGQKLAITEAKSDEAEVSEGATQAKNYAEKMHLDTTYVSNGKEIYQIRMKSGKEGGWNSFNPSWKDRDPAGEEAPPSFLTALFRRSETRIP